MNSLGPSVIHRENTRPCSPELESDFLSYEPVNSTYECIQNILNKFQHCVCFHVDNQF